MSAVALLWYRLASRGKASRLAGVFASEWEARRWLASRPIRTTAAKDGGSWLWIELEPDVWAGIGRVRDANDIRRRLAKPEGIRIQTAPVIEVDE